MKKKEALERGLIPPELFYRTGLKEKPKKEKKTQIIIEYVMHFLNLVFVTAFFGFGMYMFFRTILPQGNALLLIILSNLVSCYFMGYFLLFVIEAYEHKQLKGANKWKNKTKRGKK